MSLPTSRNTNYAAGSQVLSADLNDIQDKIIAAHSDGVHGNRKLFIHGSAAGVPTEATDYSKDEDGIRAQNALFAVPLPVGTRINALIAHLDTDTDSGNRTITLRRKAIAGASGDIGSSTETTTNSQYPLELVSGLPHTIADDYIYQVFVQTKDPDIVEGIEFNYDRPA